MAAVTLVVKGAVVSPTRFLRRRMKSDVRDVHPGSKRHAERLDGAIEVLVVERVFIVPDASTGVRDFVAHEPDAVVARIGLEPVADRCACPGHDGGLHALGGAGRRKCVVVPAAADVKPTVGGVIVHVALPGILLAP